MLLGVGFLFTVRLGQTHRVEGGLGHSVTTASFAFHRQQYSTSSTSTSVQTP